MGLIKEPQEEQDATKSGKIGLVMYSSEGLTHKSDLIIHRITTDFMPVFQGWLFGAKSLFQTTTHPVEVVERKIFATDYYFGRPATSNVLKHVGSNPR